MRTFTLWNFFMNIYSTMMGNDYYIEKRQHIRLYSYGRLCLTCKADLYNTQKRSLIIYNRIDYI